jgi:hypothetical protein
VKITEGIKIILSCGSCSDNMIDLSEELLNERIYSDYKQSTDFITIRKTGFSSSTCFGSKSLQASLDLI